MKDNESGTKCQKWQQKVKKIRRLTQEASRPK